jgi:hypothetical protein
MMSGLLRGYAALLLVVCTASVAAAQLVTWCWWPCGSDRVTVSWEATGRDDSVVIHTDSPHPQDMLLICESAGQRSAVGMPAPGRTFRTMVGTEEIFRQAKPHGQNIAQATVPTHVTDHPPPPAAGACPAPQRPLVVLTLHSQVTACITRAGAVVQTVQATCRYPESQERWQAETQWAFLGLVPVSAPCHITQHVPGALGACRDE